MEMQRQRLRQRDITDWNWSSTSALAALSHPAMALTVSVVLPLLAATVATSSPATTKTTANATTGWASTWAWAVGAGSIYVSDTVLSLLSAVYLYLLVQVPWELHLYYARRRSAPATTPSSHHQHHQHQQQHPQQQHPNALCTIHATLTLHPPTAPSPFLARLFLGCALAAPPVGALALAVAKAHAVDPSTHPIACLTLAHINPWHFLLLTWARPILRLAGKLGDLNAAALHDVKANTTPSTMPSPLASLDFANAVLSPLFSFPSNNDNDSNPTAQRSHLLALQAYFDAQQRQIAARLASIHEESPNVSFAPPPRPPPSHSTAAGSPSQTTIPASALGARHGFHLAALISWLWWSPLYLSESLSAHLPDVVMGSPRRLTLVPSLPARWLSPRRPLGAMSTGIYVLTSTCLRWMALTPLLPIIVTVAVLQTVWSAFWFGFTVPSRLLRALAAATDPQRQLLAPGASKIGSLASGGSRRRRGSVHDTPPPPPVFATELEATPEPSEPEAAAPDRLWLVVDGLFGALRWIVGPSTSPALPGRPRSGSKHLRRHRTRSSEHVATTTAATTGAAAADVDPGSS
ncbi:hypothetical protein BC828DRAFT_384057 [Blastocladiella britannica]|nr:hypothetical protein BC828DRAFT_384057 [Blastocladiella britannica]